MDTTTLWDLTPQEDVGPFGRVTSIRCRVRPCARRCCACPTVIFVLNIIRIPGSNDPAAAERLVARNRVLYERIRDQGGVLYPVSALPMSADDWQRHFDTAWPGLQDARRRYDPAGILTPGYLSSRP
jgi:cytokinin dehydrogenase